jgi:hypothetical protein
LQNLIEDRGKQPPTATYTPTFNEETTMLKIELPT